VTVGGEVKFGCIDGPEFDAHQVDFKNLADRNRIYQHEEKEADDAFAHECNLTRQA
jgi:ferredoxin--NADP+ reductase